MDINLAGDVNAKSVYLRLINKTRGEYSSLTRKLDRILKAKEQCYNYLFPRREEIAATLNINLDNYVIEFTSQRFNEDLSLETIVSKLLRLKTDSEYRKDIIQLAKWCSIIRNEYEVTNRLTISKKILNLSYRKYEDFISKFFTKVHKVLLEGDAYKLGYSLGTIYLDCIEYDSKARNGKLDFIKTALARKELIEKGDYEAAKNVKVQFTRNKDLILRIVNSKYFTSQSMFKFKFSDYVNLKYRNMTYEDIAKTYCKKESDVYPMQLSLKRKINILGYINPGFYLKFKDN